MLPYTLLLPKIVLVISEMSKCEMLHRNIAVLYHSIHRKGPSRLSTMLIIYLFVYLCLHLFILLGSERKGLCILGKHSTIEPMALCNYF
jgi:hypothetical protein